MKTLDVNFRVYQPIPLEEYAHHKATREDSPERYDVIKADYGSFKGRWMYDLCSANCYFGFRFLQDGGEQVVAVESDLPTLQFVKNLVIEKNLQLEIYGSIEEASAVYDAGFHDIGLYLDTHLAKGTEGYLEHMAESCKVLYTSCKDPNVNYEEMLKQLFKNVKEIFHGKYDRKLYRCED